MTGYNQSIQKQQTQTAKPAQSADDVMFNFNYNTDNIDRMLQNVRSTTDYASGTAEFLNTAEAAGKIPNPNDPTIEEARAIHPEMSQTAIYSEFPQVAQRYADNPDQIKDKNDRVEWLKNQWNTNVSTATPEEQQAWFHDLAAEAMHQYKDLDRLKDKLFKANQAKSAGLN